MKAKGIRVAVDVFAGEPAQTSGKLETALFKEPGIIGTHHIGASTDQAQDAIARETVRIVIEYATTGKVPNCVNTAVRTPATHLLVVRHRDRVGVLAHVFAHLKDAGINVQKTDNTVFDGAKAATALIQLDQAPDALLLEKIRSGSEDILELSLKAI